MTDLMTIQVPDIGGAIDVEVIELLVGVGDLVEVDQGLISIETDKATMEIPSSHQGVIQELLVAEGSKVNEGDIIARLKVEAVGEPQPELHEDNFSGSEPVADIGEDDKKPIADSSHMEKDESTIALDRKKSDLGMRGNPRPPVASRNSVYASPSVRKLARELEVSLVEVTPTGVRGRLTKEDVYEYIKGRLREGRNKVQSEAGDLFSGLPVWPKVDFEKYGPVERVELSRLKKISGPNLHRNWISIPHVTNHEEADITDLEVFRGEMNNELLAEGTKVTLLALIIKACVATLKKFPHFNASLDGQELVLKQYYHIGFAADTPNGLVVPVIHNADQKGIADIANELSVLARKAREGKLTIDEMSGGTFSVSSLGGIGGTYFTPIINAPEVAILGVGKARERVVWDGDRPAPRLFLPLSLSWDHRAIDGAMAGRFNDYLARVLSDLKRVLM